MPGCWMQAGLNGLEEVTGVTAFWGEGVGRNSHTLKLQELGVVRVKICKTNIKLCDLEWLLPDRFQHTLISAELLKLERVRLSSNPLSPECRHLRHLLQSCLHRASSHQPSRSRPPESEISIVGGSNPLPQGITGRHRGSDILLPARLKSIEIHRNP